MSRLWENYSWIMKNALKSNEWRRILVNKAFKIEIQNRGENNLNFLENWFPQEIRSSLFNLQKFQDSEKATLESCRMHWNLMSADEFCSMKLLKFKYSREDQIIQTFCKICSPQKLGPPTLICRNLKTLSKVLLNHAEQIQIQLMIKNFSQ